MQPTPLQINKPCHENWGAMTPNERGRHCASCNKTVVDLTAMPVAQAAAFMNDLGDRLRSRPDQHVCVRAHADTSGRLMKPGARRLLLTNGLAAILAMSLSGCGQNTTNSQHLTPPPQPNSTPADPQVPLMGAVAPQQTMGEPSVCPPPNPRVEMGDVMYQPEPQELMGKVVAPPPKALEVLGQVVAPPEPPVIKGEVHIPDPAEKK